MRGTFKIVPTHAPAVAVVVRMSSNMTIQLARGTTGTHKRNGWSQSERKGGPAEGEREREKATMMGTENSQLVNPHTRGF